MSAVDLLPCPFCQKPGELGGFDGQWYCRCTDADCWAGNHASLWVDHADAIAAWNRRAPVSATQNYADPVSSAAPASAGKALVWEVTGWSSGDGVKGENDDTWTASALGFKYCTYGIDWFGGSDFRLCDPDDKRTSHPSLDAAKAAAQADYEARILSALIPGDGWRDGIRQLLAADQAFMDGTRLSDHNRALARHVAIASTYGSAAFLARMDDDQGTHAMMRAILTALLDPLDPELDYLRADPSMGAKARAERAASQPQGINGEGKA